MNEWRAAAIGVVVMLLVAAVIGVWLVFFVQTPSQSHASIALVLPASVHGR
jgi:hypothetical protein